MKWRVLNTPRSSFSPQTSGNRREIPDTGVSYASVTQRVCRQFVAGPLPHLLLAMQNVVGSNPISRSPGGSGLRCLSFRRRRAGKPATGRLGFWARYWGQARFLASPDGRARRPASTETGLVTRISGSIEVSDGPEPATAWTTTGISTRRTASRPPCGAPRDAAAYVRPRRARKPQARQEWDRYLTVRPAPRATNSSTIKPWRDRASRRRPNRLTQVPASRHGETRSRHGRDRDTEAFGPIRTMGHAVTAPLVTPASSPTCSA
jgi:hypothetical protein